MTDQTLKYIPSDPEQVSKNVSVTRTTDGVIDTFTYQIRNYSYMVPFARSVLPFWFSLASSTVRLSAPNSIEFLAASQPHTVVGLSVTDIVPAWPSFDDVVFLFDLENDRYFWDGQERLLSEATDHGDGTYTVNLATSIDVGDSTGIIDVTNPVTTVTYETAFSMLGPSNARFEAFSSQGRALRIFDSAAGGEARYDFDEVFASQGSTFQRFRTGWTNPIGSPKILRAGWAPSDVNTSGVSSIMNTVGIGRREFSAPGDIFSGTVNMVAIFNSLKSENELRVLMAESRSNIGIHHIGDSVYNNAEVRQQFDELVKPRGHFFSSVDQVGGSTLAETATRFAADSLHWDKTLVIYDLGLTPDGTSVSAVESIVSNLPHDRWVYVQSNPQYAPGVATRPAWDVEDAAIRAYCGDHYLETLPTFQANGDGSANDNADIADDLIPRSLRTDIVHLNDAGQNIAAQAIYDHLNDRGWLAYKVSVTIPGSVLSVTGSTSADVAGGGTSSITISGSEADVNTELASLSINALGAGSHDMTVTTSNPLTGVTDTEVIPITVT